ncbi:hypothetical protein MYP_2729 [Sporocytophaga myxococcoides]|uniref:DUF1800 domain-containing protein n=1 Tax=Sporocytophaga myxococcoides TaxID=153721 RepID=A0A098LEY5_9BACT|nr:DUF1800 domain-containing protein [Sporocytophaga myxococcoides]GAL85500.1 hypothetical protein MYP_2729 [Sporocytophaga myxococcoides]
MIKRRTFIQAGSLMALPFLLPEKLLTAKPLELNSTTFQSQKDQTWNLLGKVTYGPLKKDILKVKKNGFQAYIKEQLNAPSEDSQEILQRIHSTQLDIKYDYNGYNVDEWRPITYLDKDLKFCRKEFEKVKEKGWHEWIRPGMEVVSANWIRAVYSPWQLKEMMVEFWHNHFNVTVNGDMAMGSCMPTYDRDVIRKHAFGNFRQFLEDVAKSPAMLYYLNNKSSQASPANENYARELFELHTLGSEHYLNSLYDRWRDVPGALEGKPVGYIDEDVYEASRAFTGWTVADGSFIWRGGGREEFPDTGEFFYYDAWHDNYQKRILGHEIKSNMPAMYDGRKVLDLVAFHPGTGKNICRKFLLRFMGDDYPSSLLSKAQAVWLQNINSPDQIKITLQAIFESPEFLNYKGQKVKRPYEFIVSVARATEAEFTPTMMLQWQIMGMGYKPFMWPAPTGHPDKDSNWMGPGAMLTRWRTISSILYWKGMGVFKFKFAEQTPGGLSYQAIADYWSEKLTGIRLQEKYRSRIAVLLADNAAPDSIPTINETQMEQKLTMLAQFLLSTPEFQTR